MFINQICIVYFVILMKWSHPQTVPYLENLINSEIEKTRHFHFPNDNGAFFENITNSNVSDYGNFDFIIVGAGSAGSVVANRLSEINKWNILLLEAGSNEDDFTDIPEVAALLQLSPRNWGYNSTSQTTCCSAYQRNQIEYPRGKIIGGSSTINACIYVRGNRANFDAWAALGNEGWSYEDVLPYFIKSENATFLGDTGYTGYNGTYTVSYVRPRHPLVNYYINAVRELGYNVLLDYNGRKQIGVSQAQTSMKNGRRVSTGRAYLDPILRRRNLNITINAFVTKVLLDRSVSSKIRAIGVVFIKNGKYYKATAKKDVILSAGAINTPQILMLSGIGPKQVLNSVNITVEKELPVGQNLQDHNMLTQMYINSNLMYNDLNLEQEIQQYLNGLGELTASINVRAVNFISTKNSSNPDLELIFIPPSQTPLQLTSPAILNYRPEVASSIFANNKRGVTSIFFLVGLQPLSRGQVILKSNSPRDFPNIDLGYFSDSKQQDLEVLYKGIRFIQKLIQTKSFRTINATFATPTNFVLCNKYVPDSKKYWYCFIRSLATTIYHPTGTTSMGTNETTSVVNSKLKVHGIENVRIIDAGIMPLITSGNINAPTIMIGEKASDIIKNEYPH